MKEQLRAGITMDGSADTESVAATSKMFAT
jgi:hypothetical protein